MEIYLQSGRRLVLAEDGGASVNGAPPLGEDWRGLREVMGKTGEEMGRVCGVGKKAVSAWENGHRQPSKAAVMALRQAVGGVAGKASSGRPAVWEPMADGVTHRLVVGPAVLAVTTHAPCGWKTSVLGRFAPGYQGSFPVAQKVAAKELRRIKKLLAEAGV